MLYKCKKGNNNKKKKPNETDNTMTKRNENETLNNCSEILQKEMKCDQYSTKTKI